MAQFPDLETFRTHLETRGLDSTRLETRPVPTMSLRDAPTLPHTSSRPRLHTLPELAVGSVDEVGAELDFSFIDILGEGGMGVVRLANQNALDRKVAVKTIRPDVDEEVSRILLQEAFVTGYLEHPNIIPVYTVGRDPDGAPLIVMKRVEGQSWLEMLDEMHGADGQSNWTRHVEILIDVANAVRFAHSRGIIHRDIKPENVMVGDYDEVYLLDWGLAASMRDDKPLLPTLEESDSMCGTPGYMAPEMAQHDVDQLDERTDVYLLGTTLHHMLVGRVRHRGKTMLQMLYAAHQSEPFDYGRDVPDELADIANMACHRDPDERFQSTEAFRNALRNFLEHRESIVLSRSAHDKMNELRELLGDTDPDAATVHDTWGECKFGFEQALRIWPDNQKARHGLQQSLVAMVGYHLGQRNPEGARACLADLPETRPDLEQRIQRLERELKHQREELQRLQKLEDSLDLSTAASSRSLVAFVLGIIWTAASLFMGLRVDQGMMTVDEELREHALSGIRNFAIAVAAVFLFRKRLMANAVNRRIVYLLLTMLAVLAFVRWSVWYMDAGLVMGRTADNAIYIVTIVAMGLLTDIRICLVAVVFVVAAVVGVVWPEFQLYAKAGAVAATFGTFAWMWAPRRVHDRLWPW